MGEKLEQERQFTRRAFALVAGQTAAFALLGWRYFELQVVDGKRYAPLADDNRISLQIVVPKRGRIFDASGRPLADNDETFRATLNPALTSDVAKTMAALQRVLPLSANDIEAVIRRSKKQARGLPTVIATDLTFDQVAQLNLLAPNLAGVRTEIAWRRRYHGGAPVGHSVGYVGSLGRFGIDDEAYLRLPEMRVGKSGAEAGYESRLQGTGGIEKVEVNARGRVVRNLESQAAVAGQDLRLAIDLELQRAIAERMQSEKRAATVVLDIASGEIAAMVSVPGYDPAAVAEGISEADWQRLASSEDKPLLNRCVAGQYPPGSTFKVVTALAALEAGVVSASEHIKCDGHYDYAGQTYRCWARSGHGNMSLHTAIRSSCDIFFFEMAHRLGIQRIAQMARKLGLGSASGCGLPEEKAGLIPDPDWKRGNWNAGWLGGETLLSGIGQGYVLTTPLQLAVMTARIASAKQVLPSLAQRDDPKSDTRFASLDIAQASLDAVRHAMVAVVNEGGTGSKANLGEGRPLVAGKTGTSQVSRLSSETAEQELAWGQRDHALFVAYTPVDAPKYAIATIVEHGGGGGATSAPLSRDILNLVLDRDARRAGETTDVIAPGSARADQRSG